MRVLRFALIAAVVAAASVASAAAPKKDAPAPLPSGKAQVTDSEVGLEAQDGARKAAEDYLKAIAHQGNDGAIESLLGGATLTARLYTIENWKIVGREKHRHETGEVTDLNAYVVAIDKAGRDALSTMIGGGPAASDSDGLGVSLPRPNWWAGGSPTSCRCFSRPTIFQFSMEYSRAVSVAPPSSDSMAPSLP
jgi:hypothetical protein